VFVGVYPYDYDADCYWLRRRAVYSGSPYWWNGERVVLIARSGASDAGCAGRGRAEAILQPSCRRCSQRCRLSEHAPAGARPFGPARVPAGFGPWLSQGVRARSR
jgi:hypothetical protein